MNETIQVLNGLKAREQKRKEAKLRQDLRRILEKSSIQGGLFTGGDILYLLAKISDAYPGMSAKEQERRVRSLLLKYISPERECFYTDTRRAR